MSWEHARHDAIRDSALRAAQETCHHCGSPMHERGETDRRLACPVCEPDCPAMGEHVEPVCATHAPCCVAHCGCE